MNNRTRFAIVIPLYRGLGTMEGPLGHLRSVIENNQICLDIFLFDDASGDETIDNAIKILAAPQVALHVFRGLENRGESAAVNRLFDEIRKAGFEWGLVLHQDDWVLQSWLLGLDGLLANVDPRVGAIRPSHEAAYLDGANTPEAVVRRYSLISSESANSSHFCGLSDLRRWAECRPVPFTGATLSSTWMRAVGGWTEGITFHGDLDYGCRLLSARSWIADYAAVGVIKVSHQRSTQSTLGRGRPEPVAYTTVAVNERYPELHGDRILFRIVQLVGSSLYHAARNLRRPDVSVRRRQARWLLKGATCYLRCVPWLITRAVRLAPPEYMEIRHRVFRTVPVKG